MLEQVARAASSERPARRDYLVTRFEKAVAAYERGRDQEALRLLAPLVQDLPQVAPVRQLAGLAAYRVGRWRDAARHLEAYQRLSGDPSGTAMVMDSYRALGRYPKVADTWAELRRSSPDAELACEARMVAAGALGDTGDLKGAISLLAASGGGRALRNPAERHLRQWYALADLYERAGDLPRARELFARIERAEPDFYDAALRLEGLGEGPPTPKRRPGPKGARRNN